MFKERVRYLKGCHLLILLEYPLKTVAHTLYTFTPLERVMVSQYAYNLKRLRLNIKRKHPKRCEVQYNFWLQYNCLEDVCR